jgi:hypothetical protein
VRWLWSSGELTAAARQSDLLKVGTMTLTNDWLIAASACRVAS